MSPRARPSLYLQISLQIKAKRRAGSREVSYKWYEPSRDKTPDSRPPLLFFLKKQTKGEDRGNRYR